MLNMPPTLLRKGRVLEPQVESNPQKLAIGLGSRAGGSESGSGLGPAAAQAGLSLVSAGDVGRGRGWKRRES